MPVCITVRGKRCLVIGGGNVALRKIGVLLKFGAKVTCVSPKSVDGILTLKGSGRITLIQEKYSPRTSFKACRLVIAATNDRGVNRRIAARAKKEGVLVNVVDGSVPGDVIMPAIYTKNGFSIAVSTDGRDPSAAKKLRDSLEDVL